MPYKPNRECIFEIAFKQLYSKYSGKVYNFIMRISGGNEYLAEEVMQVAFMKLWERRDHFEDTDMLVPYLFTTVRNVFFNMCEHEAVRYAYDQLLRKNATIESNDNIEEMIDDETLNSVVDKLVESLPLRQRQVFLKSRVEKKSYHTIAEELNISEKTVGAHMSFALKYLKEHLTNYASIIAVIIMIISM